MTTATENQNAEHTNAHPRPIHKLLIANRGEIACRIIRTCKTLGISTVAVYSEADALGQHVKQADEAIAIGGAAAAQSYLRADRIIAAAKKTGAQAIHPGFGFLAENAGFAQACADAGLIFVGPPASAIDAMGLKDAAKAIMDEAGVPTVPGYLGEQQDTQTLAAEAQRIGYPLLIKAAAGGGGKGMRIVRSADDFSDALAAAKRESAAAFGNDHVLLEKYLEFGRHIEVQVFADQSGNAIYLNERDCSLQRRHQKIIEEAPAPAADSEFRTAIGEAAVKAAQAVGYVGAGTVEFIVDQDMNFYFMEMNTRLQVEHPVTEMITGFDLVAWQLTIAAGNELPCSQAQVPLHGHAIEARLYAEDPHNQFLPSIGRIDYLQFPTANTGLRIDSGIAEGDEVTVHYDPMVAKLIVHGGDRAGAIAAMKRALEQTHVIGVTTNIRFLHNMLGTEEFQQGTVHTSMLDDDLAAYLPDATHASPLHHALAAVGCKALRDAQQPALLPTALHNGWRLNAGHSTTLGLQIDGQATLCRITETLADLDSNATTADSGNSATQATVVELDDNVITLLDLQTTPISDHATQISAVIEDQHCAVTVVMDSNAIHVIEREQVTTVPLFDAMAQLGDDATQDSGEVRSPMPGNVIRLDVKVGDRVAKDDVLVVVEAMKMEHALRATFDGQVEHIAVAQGQQVIEGEVLLTIDAADE